MPSNPPHGNNPPEPPRGRHRHPQQRGPQPFRRLFRRDQRPRAVPRRLGLPGPARIPSPDNRHPGTRVRRAGSPRASPTSRASPGTSAGHVMFSHYPYYDRLFEKLMGDEFTSTTARAGCACSTPGSRTRSRTTSATCPSTPRTSASRPHQGPDRQGKGQEPRGGANFGEFIDAVFGEGIAKHFMRPYNFKVWAYPPEMMNKQWIGERVAVLDVDRALKNVVLEQRRLRLGAQQPLQVPAQGRHRRVLPAHRPTASKDQIRLGRPSPPSTSTPGSSPHGDGSQERYDTLISAMPARCALPRHPDRRRARSAPRARPSASCTPAATWSASASSARARAPRAGCTSPSPTAPSTASPTSPTTRPT
jgi:hypothetical protein